MSNISLIIPVFTLIIYPLRSTGVNWESASWRTLDGCPRKQRCFRTVLTHRTYTSPLLKPFTSYIIYIYITLYYTMFKVIQGYTWGYHSINGLIFHVMTYFKHLKTGQARCRKSGASCHQRQNHKDVHQHQCKYDGRLTALVRYDGMPMISEGADDG